MTDSKPQDGYFDAYGRFANTLRAWLVAYGVGGPVLVATNQHLASKLTSSGTLTTVAFYFIVGVGLQVVAALIFKSAMWYLYLGEEKPVLKATRRYRIAFWASEAYWIEALLDAGTISYFGLASYQILISLQ